MSNFSPSPAGRHGHTAEVDAHVTDLALRAARGDKGALNEFISATHDDVWRLLAHLANPDQADDLTQETYLRVLSALPRFAARSTARTWILSLARRVWVDSIRHDMARPRKSAAEWEDAAGDTPAAETTGGSSWVEWLDTQDMLNSLEPDRREALILTQMLGYTYAEAAKIANVRTGTIRSRVARARAELVDMQQAQQARQERQQAETTGTTRLGRRLRQA
ncbi:RNA polymerase sigma factor [Corynebacterium urealyticum]|uniref:RNA polymerase sigma factor n=1 Tax=Corynebacterium urealyticum TaxID=43771 RepID=UPI0002B3F4D9|nr:RNA polymerase sigma factor [Corynebacterium urealyticum]AGE37399.1 ECF-family sigma factor C [Corynebacterium urealyticum DSM 7111]QQB07232.1 RNA polymerase sigma factor [Corynebacterium urealyticum]